MSQSPCKKGNKFWVIDYFAETEDKYHRRRTRGQEISGNFNNKT